MANNKFQFSIAGIDNDLVKRSVLSYVGVFFLVMLAVFFVWPRMAEVSLVKNKFNKEELKTRNTRDSLSALDEFESRVGRNNVDLINLALPVEFKPGLVLNELRSLSNEEGVIILSYNLDGGRLDKEAGSPQVDGEAEKTSRAVGLKRVRMTLTVSGLPANLISFMKSLEEALPVASISQVDATEIAMVVQGQAEGASSVTDEISLDLELTYYYYPYAGVGAGSTLDEYLISSEDFSLIGKISSYRRPAQPDAVVEVEGGNENLFGVD